MERTSSRSSNSRWAAWGLAALVGWVLWPSANFASSGKAPAVRAVSSRTGEVAGSASSDPQASGGSNLKAVPLGQRPAPKLEEDLQNVVGDRSPPSHDDIPEIRFERTQDSRYRILEVDPKGPFKRYHAGEVIDHIPMPEEPEFED